ncbi:MAG: hypothetical protein ACREJU_20475 [Nitrospiraceae bacterium]
MLSPGQTVGRFTLLLWSLPPFLVISQLISDLPGWRVFLDLLIALLLVASVRATGLPRGGQIGAWSIACFAVLAHLANHAVHDNRLQTAGTISWTLFMVLVTGSFLLYAVRTITSGAAIGICFQGEMSGPCNRDQM